MSVGEKRRITRRFIASLGDDIGPHTDIPAPDMYTDAETMAWIYDTYQMMHPHAANLGVVTGKPLDLGGIPGRGTATAQGLAYVLERLLALGEVPGLRGIPGTRIAIQGFGNAGRHAAFILRDMGASIVAVSDITGGAADPNGLDLEQVEAHLEGHRVGARGPRHPTPRRPGPTRGGLRHPGAGRPGEPDHPGERGASEGLPGDRSGQRADHARGRPHPRASGDRRGPRHPGQRRRAWSSPTSSGCRTWTTSSGTSTSSRSA